VAKLTRLTHKIAIQLHLVAESCIICSSAWGNQSRNFWIYPHMGSKGIASHILNLSTRWRWMVSFILQPLYSRESTW